MTAEMVTAALAGIAGIIVAIAQLAKILRRTKAIEENTNGTLEASAAVRKELETQVAGLEERLVSAIEEKLKAASVARQAADDVRKAMGRES